MSAIKEFEKAVSEDLSLLKRDLEDLATQLREISEKRIAIGAKIEERVTALKVIRELAGTTATPTAPSIPLFPEIPLGTISEMSEQYMLGHGGEADVSDLVEFLREREKLPLTGSKHGHYGTVFGTLRKSKRFRKVDGAKGRFALAAGPHIRAGQPEPTNGEGHSSELGRTVPMGALVNS